MNGLTHFAACAGVCAFAFAVAANAQIGPTRFEVNVSFSFFVSDRNMPAGEYIIDRVSYADPETMLIKQASVTGRNIFYDREYKVALCHASSLVTRGRNQALSTPSMVFNKYGNDRYFLSQIWSGAERSGIQLPKSRRERELITSKVVAQNAPTEVVIEVLTRK